MQGLVSAKLTVLAAPPVVPAERGIGAIVSILTGNAKANAGHGFSSRFGNTGAAFGAVGQGRTLGQTALRAALRATDPILHGRVDLILYCTVTRPTRRHLLPPNDPIAPLASALSLWLRGGPNASVGVSPASADIKEYLSICYRVFIK